MKHSDTADPTGGLVVTQILVVADQDRARDFYVGVLGAEVVRERDPVIPGLAGSTIILNTGGGPTDDKPGVTLAPPTDITTTSAFLTLRVSDVAAVHAAWTVRGARFLNEPVDRGPEIRCYLRDPDGHLIEVGQATGAPAGPNPEDG